MSRPTYPVRRLLAPTDAEKKQVTQVLMEGFRGDPFLTMALGPQATNEDVYHRFYHAHTLGCLVDGELWVAEADAPLAPLEGEQGKGKREIVGVALWFPPGKEFLGSEEQRGVAGMGKVMDDLGEGMKRWWFDYFIPKNTQQAAGSLGPTGRVDALHLLSIAVLPAFHNRGMGRALMLSRAAQAWEAGERVVWEVGVDGNVGKYERWGGRVLNREKYEAPEEVGGEGAVMWIMELPKPGA